MYEKGFTNTDREKASINSVLLHRNRRFGCELMFLSVYGMGIIKGVQACIWIISLLKF